MEEKEDKPFSLGMRESDQNDFSDWRTWVRWGVVTAIMGGIYWVIH